MAWLFLDTHATGIVRFGFLEGGAVAVTTEALRAPALLPQVALALRDRPLPEGVCVVKGPGTFSSVRSGVLDANLLARWWGVPLVGVDSAEATEERLPALSSLLQTQGKEMAQSYIAPVYDAEPNITRPNV
ncbi:MAG: hypothetical protein WCV84_03585 [Patescibacteria group bacterium]